ncbi:MAG: hypothetical protein E2O84_06100 [Bacteroidetes bacterium]|nr:MAG: hypothetical protein E2O84_06100 [Bacteroidota bacterium]
MEYGWYDLLGNIGVIAIIGSYLGIQLDWLDARGLLYSVINAIGAVFILVSLLYSFNLSSFIIEVFWIAISLIGIVRGIAQWRINRAESA